MTLNEAVHGKVELLHSTWLTASRTTACSARDTYEGRLPIVACDVQPLLWQWCWEPPFPPSVPLQKG